MFERLTLEKFESAVYDVLPSGVERAGRDLRKDMIAHLGFDFSYGTFYTKMGRLVEGGGIAIRDDQDADGRVRYYSIKGGRRFKDKEPQPGETWDLSGLSLKPGL